MAISCASRRALDLVRFEQRIAAGQQALAEGRPAAAASLLTDEQGHGGEKPPRPPELQIRLKEASAGDAGRRGPCLAQARALLCSAIWNSLVCESVPGAVQRRSADEHAGSRRIGAGGLCGHAPPAHRRTWYRAGRAAAELHGAVLAQDPGLRPAGSAWNESARTGGQGRHRRERRGGPAGGAWRCCPHTARLVVPRALDQALIPGIRTPRRGRGDQPGSVAFMTAQSGRLVGAMPSRG